MKARHAGVCATSGDRIEPGDDVTLTDDGWSHLTCPDDRPPTAPLCHDCYIHHRGDCA